MPFASKNSLLLLCALALVVLCGVDAGSSSASSQGNNNNNNDNNNNNNNKNNNNNNNKNVFQGVMDSIKNVWNKVEATAESTLSYDFNKDGQIGEFRSQEDAIDTRQVGGDPNAAGRFQMSRPRTGRKLEAAGDKAAPAPRLRQ